jgi:adenine-specific DNA-methyltransferase
MSKDKDLQKRIKELEAEIKQLKSRKKYGLVWEDKPEDVVEQCKTQLPVLEEVEDRAILDNPEGPTNILIEGDNYHSLSVLNYTHKGKIDVIYIDPPYNTGASDWKYNNDYVDSEDSYRHSKWIAMMHNRLSIARNLLKDDGVLCALIDNYEVHNLRHILGEVFPDKDIVITVIEHNHRGRAKNNFALTHEYAIWVLKPGIETITRRKEVSQEIKRNLRRTGLGSRRHESPSMFYGIEVNKKTLEIVGVTDPIKDGEPIPVPKSKDHEIVLPIDSKNIERRWYYGRNTIMSEVRKGDIFAKVIKDKIEIHYRKDGKQMRRKSVWIGPELDGSTYGTELVTKIIGENNFPFPKSIWAVRECLSASSERKDAIFLDFFAGSGTTGHAVLDLNKEDGGNRSFILCTNNENKIAEEITYPRVKNVIKGYDNLDGIPANLRYFKTEFIDKSEVSDDVRKELVTKSTEMICIKESSYDKKYDNKDYKIYVNKNIATGILFNLDKIDDFKKKLNKVGFESHLYIFSLSNDTFESDFEDLTVQHSLVPIPESILEVYRKLFN